MIDTCRAFITGPLFATDAATGLTGAEIIALQAARGAGFAS